MEHEATINARMPAVLKRSGTEVLDRCGVSPTELVRSVYRYMEREQRLPDGLDVLTEEQENTQTQRRQIARSVAGQIHVDAPLDTKALRLRRLEERYGGLL